MVGLASLAARSSGFLNSSQGVAVLDGIVDFGKRPSAVVCDRYALGAAFGYGHGVAGIVVVEGLFRAAVIGDFTVGTGVAIDVAWRSDPTVVDLVFFQSLLIDRNA